MPVVLFSFALVESLLLYFLGRSCLENNGLFNKSTNAAPTMANASLLPSDESTEPTHFLPPSLLPFVPLHSCTLAMFNIGHHTDRILQPFVAAFLPLSLSVALSIHCAFPIQSKFPVLAYVGGKLYLHDKCHDKCHGQ